MKTFKISAYTALGFFSIGTVLFILQMIFPRNYTISEIGLKYVLLSIVINLLIILILTGRLIVYKHRKDTALGIAIILANIPIALGYLYILDIYNFI